MMLRRDSEVPCHIRWVSIGLLVAIIGGWTQACLAPCVAFGATYVPQETSSGESDANQDAGDDSVPKQNPFPTRIPFAYEFPADGQWLNTGGGRVRLDSLKGKFVLLDFWTYCCINCIHVLPELKQAEQKYANELVVIGVHSAKFDAEQDTQNIADAIQRYEIEHPVINDPDHRIWRAFDVSSWPTLYLIDPEGKLVWGRSGEVPFEDIDKILRDGVAYYRSEGLIDDSPIEFQLEARDREPTPLRYPGKILFDGEGSLYIADSNHNRIVVTDLAGKLMDTIGSGKLGSTDGDFESAEFNHPQGMAIQDGRLYIADTENHLIRRVDLEARQVTTVAGTGSQGRKPFIDLVGLAKIQDSSIQRWGGLPRETAINSPWALWIHDDELYIAMAGPHQIWKMPLDLSVIGPYAGNGREDIVDGPLLPDEPYALGFSSFAQPSGLTSDGSLLYVADSEGSSIRAVSFDPHGAARTVVGTADLPRGRLFYFGDVDGPKEQVRLQHALGIVHVDGKLFIADTYNNKIKVVDPKSGETTTVAGTGKPGSSDQDGTFDEPAGLTYANGKLFIADTNNHLIRVVDPETGSIETLEIKGLQPPDVGQTSARPSFASAQQITVESPTLAPQDGELKISVNFKFPLGWKINPLAPMGYYLRASGDGQVIDREQLSSKLYRIEKPTSKFDIAVPVKGQGEETLTVSMNYYYCRGGSEGVCKMGSVQWHIPLQVAKDGSTESVSLELDVMPN